MADPSQGIRVEIYDRVYYLRSEAGEHYTAKLAQSLDTVMRVIAEKTQTYDSLRLAVLAALHFADECEQFRERYHKLSATVSEKSVEFREALERAAEKTA